MVVARIVIHCTVAVLVLAMGLPACWRKDLSLVSWKSAPAGASVITAGACVVICLLACMRLPMHFFS
jgi:hypothetical protein